MCLADAQIDLPERAALLAARDYAQNSRIWTALVLTGIQLSATQADTAGQRVECL